MGVMGYYALQEGKRYANSEARRRARLTPAQLAAENAAQEQSASFSGKIVVSAAILFALTLCTMGALRRLTVSPLTVFCFALFAAANAAIVGKVVWRKHRTAAATLLYAAVTLGELALVSLQAFLLGAIVIPILGAIFICMSLMLLGTVQYGMLLAFSAVHEQRHRAQL